MLAALDPVLSDVRPDWVLVYGDTNSTLAGALSAVKQHLAVAHLEAGLRSWNRRMPEEHNRVLTDHASDLLLAPTEGAMANLANEGLGWRSRLVGDVMTDICLRVAAASGSRPSPVESQVGSSGEYVLATLHRAENTDDTDRLRSILDALRAFPIPVLLTAHPRLVARAQSAGIDLAGGAVRPLAPLRYPDMVAATAAARAVVTDSGGLQKEAFLLRTPCTTLRTETEWAETLEGGHNVLVDESLVNLAATALRTPHGPRAVHPYGEGNAADLVVRELVSQGR
jgi:UDP-N-acetylglucosamine 2-epimerase (non-hydrolysing)